MPALLNNRSRRPNRWFTSSNKLCTELASHTSPVITIDSVLLTAPSASVSSNCDLRRPNKTVVYPWAISASAEARPTPDPAPVINAILCVESMGIVYSPSPILIWSGDG